MRTGKSPVLFSVWRIFPNYFQTISELCSRSCLVSQAFHFVMRCLHAGRLVPDDFCDVARQRTAQRLLVTFLGIVLTGLNRFQDRLVTAAKTDFGVDPGAAKRTRYGAGDFLVRLAQPD